MVVIDKGLLSKSPFYGMRKVNDHYHISLGNMLVITDSERLYFISVEYEYPI